MICGDTYAYGAPNIPRQYAEIIISESQIINSGGVVNDDPKLKIKIKFNALQQDITTVNGVIKRTPILDKCSGEVKTKPMYLGVCDSTKTCLKNSNVYQRLCVYDDPSDPNILEFFPYVVN